MEPQAPVEGTTTPPAPPVFTQPISEPVQPPIQPAPPPELPKNKMPKKLVVFSAVLLFIAIILVAFKLILKNKATVQPAPSPTAATQPSTTPTPDPTADWETYNNSIHNISFKYPLSWGLVEQQGQKEGEQVFNTSIKLSKNESIITIFFKHGWNWRPGSNLYG